VLSPKPPKPALSLSDFLDALTTVREKLSALYIILLDHLTQQPTQIPFTSSANDIHSLLENGPTLSRSKNMSDEVAIGVEAHEREKSDREVREFLEEQISQVMGVYITDYFEKEITQVKFKFSNVLMKAVDNNKDLLTSASVLASFPKIRAEKMKTIDVIAKTIANPQLINSIFAIVTDAIVRMETIGKDDKKLPAKAKELFMLLLTFLVDGLFFPSMITSRTLLLKLAGAKPSSSALPPMDFLKILATIYSGVKRLKDFFEVSFVRPLSAQPNLIVLCKETRRNALTELEVSTRESLHAWTLSVAVHYEKVLQSVQSKYDYNPPVDPMAGIAISGLTGVKPKGTNPSNACSTLKNEMATVSDTINQYKDDLVGLNLIDAFWRPLGRQFIGGLIVHLKKQKISIDGSKVLLKDIEEYCHMTATMEAPETMDMMLSLKEIVKIYTVPGENVVKVIMEDLRQLDPTIVLALVRARTDSYARGASHWSKVLMETHGSIRADAPLPWEVKKHTTVLAFQESFSNNASIGPTTLRKSSTNLDNKKKMMNELSNAHYETEIEMDDHDHTLSSQFAPIRPDEKKILEQQYNFEIPTDLQPATISLGQRVDLIGQTPDKDKETKKKDKIVKINAPIMENPFAAFGDGMTKGFEKLRKTADKISSQIGDATHLKLGSSQTTSSNTSSNDNHANDQIGNRKANHGHEKKESIMGKLGFSMPTNPFSLSK